MSNVLGDAETWLHGVRNTKMSITVELRREGQSSQSITATPGATDIEVEQDDGATVRTERRDWLINRTDYNFGADAVEPERHDVIAETRDGTTRLYEVLPLGNELWRHSDRNGDVYRVHTKFIGTE